MLACSGSYVAFTWMSDNYLAIFRDLYVSCLSRHASCYFSLQMGMLQKATVNMSMTARACAAMLTCFPGLHVSCDEAEVVACKAQLNVSQGKDRHHSNLRPCTPAVWARMQSLVQRDFVLLYQGVCSMARTCANLSCSVGSHASFDEERVHPYRPGLGRVQSKNVSVYLYNGI